MKSLSFDDDVLAQQISQRTGYALSYVRTFIRKNKKSAAKMGARLSDPPKHTFRPK